MNPDPFGKSVAGRVRFYSRCRKRGAVLSFSPIHFDPVFCQIEEAFPVAVVTETRDWGTYAGNSGVGMSGLPFPSFGACLRNSSSSRISRPRFSISAAISSLYRVSHSIFAGNSPGISPP